MEYVWKSMEDYNSGKKRKVLGDVIDIISHWAFY